MSNYPRPHSPKVMIKWQVIFLKQPDGIRKSQKYIVKFNFKYLKGQSRQILGYILASGKLNLYFLQNRLWF
jgi:hypothetical protein